MSNLLEITASDVTGQRTVTARNVSRDASIGELLDGLLPSLNLGRRSVEEEPPQVEARLDREGRNLHRSELVGEALETGDHLVLHPRIMAGGGR